MRTQTSGVGATVRLHDARSGGRIGRQFLLRPSGPRHEFTLAIGANAVQGRLRAMRTKCAFKGANARVVLRRGQMAAAAFTKRSHFQHHNRPFARGIRVKTMR